MAYRFMLEVPEAISKEAEIAIARAPNTQIVTNRASFAEGFDLPYAALTLAVPDLTVVDTIYDWYEAEPEPRPDLRLVFYSGRRVPLADHGRGSMIAAIRRDQPWVERSIPMIGDHFTDRLGNSTDFVETGIISNAIERRGRGPMEEAIVVVEEERRVAIEDVNYLAVNVTELDKAERFYAELFDLQVVARTRSEKDGSYRLLSPDYDSTEALLADAEANDSFLRNGPLQVALHRAGRGTRLERSLLDRVSIRVDAGTFNRLRGQVAIRSYENLGGGETYFSFRDPYGVPWEITVAGALPEIISASLR